MIVEIFNLIISYIYYYRDRVLDSITMSPTIFFDFRETCCQAYDYAEDKRDLHPKVLLMVVRGLHLLNIDHK